MSKLTRLLPRLLVIGLLGVFALPQPCAACSCTPPPSPAQALVRADAVFRGRVVAVEREWSNLLPARGRYQYQRVTFEVDTNWKGPVARRVVVFTGTGQGDCGYGFQQGVEYVVYAYNRVYAE